MQCTKTCWNEVCACIGLKCASTWASYFAHSHAKKKAGGCVTIFVSQSPAHLAQKICFLWDADYAELHITTKGFFPKFVSYCFIFVNGYQWIMATSFVSDSVHSLAVAVWNGILHRQWEQIICQAELLILFLKVRLLYSPLFFLPFFCKAIYFALWRIFARRFATRETVWHIFAKVQGRSPGGFPPKCKMASHISYTAQNKSVELNSLVQFANVQGKWPRTYHFYSKYADATVDFPIDIKSNVADFACRR